MTLFFLACLLAVLSVVSTTSPIFGPQEVSRVEGSSASIKCFYPPTSVNRHSRKYWCQQGAKGRCTTLISDSYISKGYEGRANITNFPESNMFVVDISHLTESDSGHYKCGVGILNQGLFFDVRLEVIPGPGLQGDTEVYTENVGRTVVINCPFRSENANKIKSVCKKTGEICDLVVDSTDFVNSAYKDRAHIRIEGTSQLAFSFVIDRLQLGDAGMYVCKAGDDSSNADKSNAHLYVLRPEPELLYGDLRGSVAFDCALGPEAENLAKFLCREDKENTCRVVINTLGRVDEAFKGRALITDKEKGFFTVYITGLKKDEAGSYLCGAHSAGEPQEGGRTQAWQLFVNEDTTIPRTPSVVKGVVGGSVAMLCPYNPRDGEILKFWCRWNAQKGCPQAVSNRGLINKDEFKHYTGRLVLLEEPSNDLYTVILNQLTSEDAGYYWCLTSGDTHWWFTVELKIVEGEPDLEVPKSAVAWQGETLKLPCHWPCKFFSYEKYWCKWSNKGCEALPSQEEGSDQASVGCDPTNQLTSLTVNAVTKNDEGWYWCGVKEGFKFRETAAVFVEVKEGKRAFPSHCHMQCTLPTPARKDSQVPSPTRPHKKAKATSSRSQELSHVSVSAASEEEVGEPGVRAIENKAVQFPRGVAKEEEVVAVEDTGELDGGSRAAPDPSSLSSAGHGGSSTVLVSTLVPLALVLALGAVAVGVVRARHRRNVDRASLRSYRTDISMSDFENSRDFGANDNMGASSVTQETALEGKDESMAATEDTVETEEPQKAKRSSKEEADMAYAAFLVQANHMVTEAQDSPSEA